MDLNAASQAQLAAFLLSQNHPTPQTPQFVSTPPSTTSSPFDPVQALAALQWGSNGLSGPELNHSELDGWLQDQLNALTQLPLPPPPNSLPPTPMAHHNQSHSPFPSYPAPAQPHAFPPISSSRFHPYDRQPQSSSKPTRWNSQQQPQPQPHQDWTLPPPPQPPQPRRQTVLYPPDDSPPPLILSSTSNSQATTPRTNLPTPMEVSITSPSAPLPLPIEISPSKRNPLKTRRRRTRSLPPSFPTTTPISSSTKKEKLEELFDWMDEKRWNLSALLSALSEPGGSIGGDGKKDSRTPTHRRRVEEFLNLDTPSSLSGEGIEKGGLENFETRLRRWKRERRIEERDGEEKGADEIVRMWELQGGLGRKAAAAEREKGMEDAVKELHLNGNQSQPVAGVAIRSVINRYHEAYNESQADIARLDAALSRPPSPHLSSAPREPAAWSGHLIVPSLQADLLSHWLMSPGRPNLQEERQKGSIEADHMRIYSSLSPLDLHARGAEICRAILARDDSTRSAFGQHWDSLHTFIQGPSIAPLDTANFSHYDDYSLWHHALMCYLQLCVRYPAFKDSKEAHIIVSPDLPPPLHPTPLETTLIDRLLRSHWDYLRLYLLNEHGGLLRSAVRGFEGVKLSKFDLLSVVGDTIEVIEALKKSRDSTDRILPYDSSVSQIRNAWRQRAFWDPQASWVAWSAATTHFLELSALNKDWALGVKDLPGIEGLLNGSSSKTAASQALR